MCKATWHFIAGTLVFVILWSFAACSSDADLADAGGNSSPGGEMMLGIDFKVSTRSYGNDYEEGNTYENYVDVPNGNYRIYFFDTNDKFIARFEPHGFVATEGSDYSQYRVLGKAPEALLGYDEFKVVVLANWPQYGDGDMKAKTTTISDICEADWSQFNLSAENNNTGQPMLMPFYGVHTYSGISFKPNEATILRKPVSLLRALAKVEVILEADASYGDELLFSSLKINRYNAKGYCAPKGVYLQDDYDHDGVWDDDYVHTLHLVNDVNESEDKNLELKRVSTWSEGTKACEKWVAYLPEYRNKGVGDGYSSIKAKFRFQWDDDTPHTIYFAKYDKKGKTDNSDDDRRLNIERNNIYRFYVRCASYDFNLLLTVCDWEGLYENKFEYGNGQFTTPISPWDDEVDNEVEY